MKKTIISLFICGILSFGFAIVMSAQLAPLLGDMGDIMAISGNSAYLIFLWPLAQIVLNTIIGIICIITANKLRRITYD